MLSDMSEEQELLVEALGLWHNRTDAPTTKVRAGGYLDPADRPYLDGVLRRAAELGLTPGIPIAGGGGDQSAGAVGNGVIREGLTSAAVLMAIGTLRPSLVRMKTSRSSICWPVTSDTRLSV